MSEPIDTETELVMRLGALIKAVAKVERTTADRTLWRKAMTELAVERQSAHRALTSILRKRAHTERTIRNEHVNARAESVDHEAE
jgi:hypothetical protein